MNAQASHYLEAGNSLLSQGRAKEAERAFRAAQNHLMPHEDDYLASVKDVQERIIAALEAQTPAAIGAKGGAAKSEAKAVTARENGKKGGRPLSKRFRLFAEAQGVEVLRKGSTEVKNRINGAEELARLLGIE